MQFRKRLENTIRQAYDQFTLHFSTNNSFLCKREWLLSCLMLSLFDCLLQKRNQNCKKHKTIGDTLDDICCSKFQSYTLTQTTFEMTQFKMPRGTYNPLRIISRLNTETVPSNLKRLQFMQNKF